MGKRKPGRPPKTGEKFNVEIRILVTPKQRTLIADFLDGAELSTWARKVLLRDVRKN